MSLSPQIPRLIRLLVVAVAALCLLPACKRTAPSKGTANAGAVVKTNAPSATNRLAAAFRSEFDENLMPPKGRDPFFPNSHRRDPVPQRMVAGEKPPPAAQVVLKGVVGSYNHRLAVINNAILEVGEEGTVQVPAGRVRVRCIEIGEDFAVIQVEGETQPKRLELKRKDF